jgi:hypothetical protein
MAIMAAVVLNVGVNAVLNSVFGDDVLLLSDVKEENHTMPG